MTDYNNNSYSGEGTQRTELEFDPYVILNLPRDCTTKDVNDAFKRLSRTFHPDRYANRTLSQHSLDTDAANAEVSNTFMKINKAKDILSDPQKRAAYDRWGMLGVTKLETAEDAEIRSLRIAKKHRSEEAINLVQYYLRRDLQSALDKAVPSYGQVEIDVDATHLFDNLVSTLFRQQSLPHFFHTLWHGLPVLNLVVDEDGNLEGFDLLEERYAPKQNFQPAITFPSSSSTFGESSLNDDDDAEQSNQRWKNVLPDLSLDTMEPSAVTPLWNAEDDDDDDDNDDEFGLHSVSQELEESDGIVIDLPQKIELLKAAAAANDTEALSKVPFSRQSTLPMVSSVVGVLAHQYDASDKDTLVVSLTQYISIQQADSEGESANGQSGVNGPLSAGVFNELDIDWHRSGTDRTSYVLGSSIGTGTLGGKMSVTRVINNRVNVECALHVNFMDPFWRNIFQRVGGESVSGDSQALCKMFDAESKIRGRYGLWSPISAASEAGILVKEGFGLLFEFFRLYLQSVADPSAFITDSDSPRSLWESLSNIGMEDNNTVRYPGFDVSTSVTTALNREWMGMGSVRLGRQPSFRWKLWKRPMGLAEVLAGSAPLPRVKDFSFDVFLTGKNGGIEMKRVIRLGKRLRMYMKLSLDLVHVLKVEAGLSRSFIDENLEELRGELSAAGVGEGNPGDVDVRGSLGVNYSVTQGVSWDAKIARGSSTCTIPIRLSSEPSWKHLIISVAMPVLSYALYRYWYLPKKMEDYSLRSEALLNERGLEIKRMRSVALSEQKAMKIELDQKRQQQSRNNNNNNNNDSTEDETARIEIVAAFYGVSVESKMAGYFRMQLGIETPHLTPDGFCDDDDENDADQSQSSHLTGSRRMNSEDEEKRSETSHGYLWDPVSADDSGLAATAASERGPSFVTDALNRRRQREREKHEKRQSELRNIDPKFRVSLIEIDNRRSTVADWKWIRDPCDDSSEDMLLPSWLEVTTVLQYMSDNGRSLNIHAGGSKSMLAGFYDCAPDSYGSKELVVIYKYKGELYTVTVGDWMQLKLPQSSHRKWFDCSIR